MENEMEKGVQAVGPPDPILPPFDLEISNDSVGPAGPLRNLPHEICGTSRCPCAQFLAEADHKIRTAMMAVIGFAEFLTAHHSESERALSADAIIRNAEQLFQVIQELLEFSKDPAKGRPTNALVTDFSAAATPGSRKET